MAEFSNPTGHPCLRPRSWEPLRMSLWNLASEN